MHIGPIRGFSLLVEIIFTVKISPAHVAEHVRRLLILSHNLTCHLLASLSTGVSHNSIYIPADLYKSNTTIITIIGQDRMADKGREAYRGE